MNAKRVVITGVGPVSAIGIGREAFFAGLREGRSGIRGISSFDTARYRSKLAAEITGFKVADYLESQKTYLDRASELAFAALSLATRDANLELKKMDCSSVGLMLGTGYGCLATMGLFFDDFLAKGPRLVKPVLFPHTYSNTTISLLAIEYNLSGYHVSFSAGAVSASCAILEAYDLIRQGRANLVFAGGFEALSEILFAGYDRLGALSHPNSAAKERCAPFDENRNGTVLGEGSGILVLEELEHARARGARILGEIAGAGVTGGSGADGIAESMRLASKDLPFALKDLDCISASANGSGTLDADEAKAITTLLRDSPDTLIHSIKPLIGETLGASGALQMMAALAAMEQGFIPPILNLETPDPSITARIVPGTGLKKNVTKVMLNTVDPGGSVVSFVVIKPETGD